MTLPEELAGLRDKIAATKRTYIAVEATPGEAPTLKQSKLGGYPAIPKGYDYPKDSQGNYLYPLAQINFAELPALPGYPTSGIVQFYIAEDDLYGMNFDDGQEQKDFRVLFFEESELQQTEDDFEFLEEVIASKETPVQSQYTLKFAPGEEYIGMMDYRGGKNNQELQLEEFLEGVTPKEETKIEEILYSDFLSSGHKIGGYAFFTQYDPREEDGPTADYILLLQIDSKDDIMWGDSGVGNFFIHPDDLAKKDFSKVLYNWDCC
jgi:uncharacterized protein YwqG